MISPIISLCNAREHATGEYVIEASDFNLRPGFFPVTIDTDLGNARPFLFKTVEVRDGDVLWADYTQAGDATCTLRIFND